MRADCPFRFIVSKPIVYFPAVYHFLAPVAANNDNISFFFRNNQVIPTFPTDSSFAVKYSNLSTFWTGFLTIDIARRQNNSLQSKLPAVRNIVVLPLFAIDPNTVAS